MLSTQIKIKIMQITKNIKVGNLNKFLLSLFTFLFLKFP